jgi:TatD DNase family protein
MIDSHCHLAGEEFEGDLDAVVGRARDAGVAGALVILSAGDAAEASRAARVREVWPEVRFSMGIHPHQAGADAGALDERLVSLSAEVARVGAVAVGEIGLDYHYDFSPRPIQQEVFRRQLRYARQQDLPVVIHTREAEEDTFRILAEEGRGVRTVLHCFTGDVTMARRALEMGAWLSFAGIVTFPKALALQEVARLVPADRFLVETDAPYLAPVPHRGRRNEPAFVARVVDALAVLRQEAPAEVARLAAANFAAVFG